MKRQRDCQGTEIKELANFLMLLPLPQESNKKSLHRSRGPVEFECKTCNRKFPSFQALGGHRASHKRQKLEDGEEELKKQGKSLSLWNKPKMHECSICGLNFSLGQALGGHMRKHRGVAINEGSSSSYYSSSIDDLVIAKTPVLKRSNSTRIMCLGLDLNLTPLENDMLKTPPFPLSLF